MLRQLGPELDGVRVVVMTGYSETEIDQLAGVAFDAVLAKPFTSERLEEATGVLRVPKGPSRP